MAKKPFRFDERDLNNFYRICTTLYLLTIMALAGVQLYRQFVLHQPSEEWNDIAIILTVNILGCLAAILFIGGGFDPRKIKLRYIAVGYGAFLLFGFGFTVFKYAILLDEEVTAADLWNYFFLDFRISAIILLVLGLIAYLGSRRIENQIEGD